MHFPNHYTMLSQCSAISGPGRCSMGTIDGLYHFDISPLSLSKREMERGMSHHSWVPALNLCHLQGISGHWCPRRGFSDAVNRQHPARPSTTTRLGRVGSSSSKSAIEFCQCKESPDPRRTSSKEQNTRRVSDPIIPHRSRNQDCMFRTGSYPLWIVDGVNCPWRT